MICTPTLDRRFRRDPARVLCSDGQRAGVPEVRRDRGADAEAGIRATEDPLIVASKTPHAAPERANNRRLTGHPDVRDVVLRSTRDWLAQQVGAWQTVVEINPSSNLVIGQLDHPGNQPVFRLRPLDPTERAIVQVTINTDDPPTFATRLADEYAYAWAGLAVGGHAAPNYVRAWLAESAAAGWGSRFTATQGAEATPGAAATPTAP